VSIVVRFSASLQASPAESRVCQVKRNNRAGGQTAALHGPGGLPCSRSGADLLQGRMCFIMSLYTTPPLSPKASRGHVCSTHLSTSTLMKGGATCVAMRNFLPQCAQSMSAVEAGWAMHPGAHSANRNRNAPKYTNIAMPRPCGPHCAPWHPPVRALESSPLGIDSLVVSRDFTKSLTHGS